MKGNLSGEHTAEILDLAARLRERQSQKDDPTILPRVALSDIPAETPSPLPNITEGEIVELADPHLCHERRDQRQMLFLG